MNTSNTPTMEISIARCRIILSLSAILAVFLDPTRPLLSTWVPLTSGRFTIDFHVLVIMGMHLAYSLALYIVLARGWPFVIRHIAYTIWADVLFGAAIGFLTEGATSPFYPFFAFAVVVSGFRVGMRQTLLVTAISGGLYLCMIMVTASGSINFLVMRPVYLAITGYLVGYLGQQRLDLQEELRQLEASAERHRIARDLHDGLVQALAATHVRIESCRKSMQKAEYAEVLSDLTDLQEGVGREYDHLRAYMRSLAGVEVTPNVSRVPVQTHLTIDTHLSCPLDLVDQVLQIARQATSNVRRHAVASSAKIEINQEDTAVSIVVEDNGVGIPDDATPWSIASRVEELGGRMIISRGRRQGAHFSIVLPLT